MADFAEISQRMDQFRASDHAREQFVSVRRASRYSLAQSGCVLLLILPRSFLQNTMVY